MSASGTQAQALSPHHTDTDVLHSDVVIIGAGPAGLSFARAVAASGLRITVVEKSPAVRGLVGTSRRAVSLVWRACRRQAVVLF